MRILVTNDDGINAQGLERLVNIAHSLSKDVWVVAPEQNQTGVGHALSLKSLLRLRQIENRVFALDGTPADCINLGLYEILKNHKPDLILSGINKGENIAGDVTCSGTLGACMEGTINKIKSIGISQFNNHFIENYSDLDEEILPLLIKKLYNFKHYNHTFYSVNLPCCKKISGIKTTATGRYMPVNKVNKIKDQWRMEGFLIGAEVRHLEENYSQEIELLLKDYIIVTPLSLDLTNKLIINELEEYINI